MTTRNLNTTSLNWQVSALKLRSNSSLNIDSSGANIRFTRNDASLCIIGTNVDACSNSVLNSCALSVGSSDFSNNTNTNTFGAYYSFGETNTQLAFGSTATRSSTGRPGYIRYNTDDNGFEFWSTLSNTWAAISQPTPTFTSISPNYVPEDSSFNYTITGTNYTSGATIQFISVSGNIEYAPASGTSFISSTQLQARNTLQMSNDGGGVTGAGTLGYKIKITNSGGTSVTTDNAVLTYNQGPLWITAANTNLGTGVSGETYTYATSPFIDLSAVDTGAVIHNPIKYFLDPSGSTITGATSVVLDPSGRLRGTMPFVTTLTTYTFNAYPLDASGALGPVRSFAFSVTIPFTATGGDFIFTDGGYKYHIFTTTGSSTFSVTSGSKTIDYVIIGGGGGGDRDHGGGGGAGGYRYGSTSVSTSPGSYSITVGTGGSGYSPSVPAATNGGSSSAFSITSAGGGYGGASNTGAGNSGGSGGGGGGPSGPFGSGNTPSTSPSQGNNGGTGTGSGGVEPGGGGGGAGSAGSNGGTPISNGGGAGGNGSTVHSAWLSAISTNTAIATAWKNAVSPGYIAGGGGGATNSSGGNIGPGGLGGGGFGGQGGAAVTTPAPAAPSTTPATRDGQNGVPNTGSGGGGAGSNGAINAGNGGSGIVMIRYSV